MLRGAEGHVVVLHAACSIVDLLSLTNALFVIGVISVDLLRLSHFLSVTSTSNVLRLSIEAVVVIVHVLACETL